MTFTLAVSPAGHVRLAASSPARPATLRRIAKPKGFASRTAPASSSSHPAPTRRTGLSLGPAGAVRGVPSSRRRTHRRGGGTRLFRVQLACGPP